VSRWIAHVRVTLKAAVNDPQGLAIRGGLHQLGFDAVSSVRAGKFFEIQLDAPTRSDADRLVADMGRRLLANPVIEDFTFQLVGADQAP
jgi:phosphoribosylformylglycinamidine synthase PurS subunit